MQVNNACATVEYTLYRLCFAIFCPKIKPWNICMLYQKIHQVCEKCELHQHIQPTSFAAMFLGETVITLKISEGTRTPCGTYTGELPILLNDFQRGPGGPPVSEFLVLQREFKSLIKRSWKLWLLLYSKLCKTTYVQYSFDWLFMRCRHSKVDHRIIFEKDGSKVKNHWFNPHACALCLACRAGA